MLQLPRSPLTGSAHPAAPPQKCQRLGHDVIGESAWGDDEPSSTSTWMLAAGTSGTVSRPRGTSGRCPRPEPAPPLLSLILTTSSTTTTSLSPRRGSRATETRPPSRTSIRSSPGTPPPLVTISLLLTALFPPPSPPSPSSRKMTLPSLKVLWTPSLLAYTALLSAPPLPPTALLVPLDRVGPACGAVLYLRTLAPLL